MRYFRAIALCEEEPYEIRSLRTRKMSGQGVAAQGQGVYSRAHPPFMHTSLGFRCYALGGVGAENR